MQYKQRVGKSMQFIATVSILLTFTAYALISTRLHETRLVLLLLPLLGVTEWFPLRIQRLRFPIVFPILYTLGFVNGYGLTGLLSILVLFLVNLLKRRPWPQTINAVSIRLFALMMAAAFAHGMTSLNLYQSSFFIHNFLNLGSAVLGFSMAGLLLTNLYETHLTEKSPVRNFLCYFIHAVVTLGYDAFMLWLASNPKNLGSGSLGTFFFFLPLTILTIVVHLFMNLSTSNARLESLFTVSQRITQQSNLQTVFNRITSEGCRIVEGDRGTLFIRQPDSEYFHLEVDTSETLSERTLPVKSELIGTVFATGQPQLLHDLTHLKNVNGPPMPSVATLLLVPIHIDNGVVGVIAIGKRDAYAFRRFDLHLMTVFATHASVAIKNAMYMEERERRILAEERNRLAREIHDGIAQDLAGAILQVEMIKRSTAQAPALDLNQLQDNLKQVVGTVRESIYTLRPEPYQHIGLVPAIRSYLDDAAKDSDMNITFTENGLPDDLSPTIAEALYQILQESIRNALKHANADLIHVQLSYLANTVTLSIEDNGRGFNFGKTILKAGKSKSFGIENLHTIAENIGGSLDFDTNPEVGTTVTFEIALEEESIGVDTSTAL